MSHSCPAAAENTLSAVNTPPSVPTYTRTPPSGSGATAAACQSGCTQLSAPQRTTSRSPWYETLSQRGLGAVPLVVRMPHTCPPMITWASFVGSTATAWLYQLWLCPRFMSRQSYVEPEIAIGFDSAPRADVKFAPPSVERRMSPSWLVPPAAPSSTVSAHAYTAVCSGSVVAPTPSVRRPKAPAGIGSAAAARAEVQVAPPSAERQMSPRLPSRQ